MSRIYPHVPTLCQIAAAVAESPMPLREFQPHLAVVFDDVAGLDRFGRGAGLDLAGPGVELAAMPEALDRAVDQHAVGQAPAAVRAAVLERAVAGLVARE